MFGLAPGCLGCTVVCHSDMVTHMPRSFDFESAATAPTVYITVFAAFEDSLRHGGHVLVHAGTGGVGLAAISVGHAVGCQVAATASSFAKRSHLRRLGVLAASDSRSTMFTDPHMSAAGPFNAVLNSLTSPGRPEQDNMCHCMGHPIKACDRDTKYAKVKITRNTLISRGFMMQACLRPPWVA